MTPQEQTVSLVAALTACLERRLAGDAMAAEPEALDAAARAALSGEPLAVTTEQANKLVNDARDALKKRDAVATWALAQAARWIAHQRREADPSAMLVEAYACQTIALVEAGTGYRVPAEAAALAARDAFSAADRPEEAASCETLLARIRELPEDSGTQDAPMDDRQRASAAQVLAIAAALGACLDRRLAGEAQATDLTALGTAARAALDDEPLVVTLAEATAVAGATGDVLSARDTRRGWALAHAARWIALQLRDTDADASLVEAYAWATVARAEGALFRWDDAVAAYTRAVTISQGMLAAGRTELRNHLAGVLNNRGIALQGQGRLQAAVDDYTAAEQIRRVLVEQEGCAELRNDLAGVLNNRGTALWDQGRLQAAIDDYTDAEQIRRVLVEQEGRAELRNNLAGTLMNLGSLYQEAAAVVEADRAADMTAAAAASYERALTDAGEVLDVNWELAWKLRLAAGRARLRERSPRRVEALELFETAVEVLERVRAFQQTSDDRLVFMADKTQPYVLAIETALGLAARAGIEPAESERYAERAYATLLRLKARRLGEALAERPLAERLDQLSPDRRAGLDAALRRADELRQALLGPELGRAAPDGPGEAGGHDRADDAAAQAQTERYLRWLAELRAADTAVARLRAELAHDPTAVATGLATPTIEATAEALGPDALVLDWFIGSETVALFTLRRNDDRAELQVYPLDASGLGEAIKEALYQIDEVAPDNRAGAASELKYGMHQIPTSLDRLLLPETVHDDVRAAHQLWLVPHGDLARLSLLDLHLANGQADRSEPLTTSTRLASRVPTATLLPLLDRPANGPEPRPFDLDLLAVAADVIPDAGIPLVDHEAAAIATVYRSDRSRLHTTRHPAPPRPMPCDELLDLLAAGGTIGSLLISAHGSVIDPARPGEVVLWLAGPNGAPAPLSGQTIATRARARIDLVHLGCCFSGRLNHGHEAEGLVTAFMVATRARALIVALWPVADAAAAVFGQALHEEWRRDGGCPLGVAYLRARERLRKTTWGDARRRWSAVSMAGRALRGDLHGWDGRTDGASVDGDDTGDDRAEPPDDEPIGTYLDEVGFQLVGDPTLRPA